MHTHIETHTESTAGDKGNSVLETQFLATLGWAIHELLPAK